MSNNKTYNFDIDNNSRIISELRTGNEECFDAVYRYYFGGLCAYSMRFVTLDRAQEIVQDTMMWLWENRTTLIPDMSLKSLLFVIVKNKSLNRVSHNQIKSRVHKMLAEKMEKQFDDPDIYLNNELTDKFSDALTRLPEEIRVVFEMNRVQGMTHKEIAQLLNVSHQTVNYRIGQALKVLRYELKDFL